MTDRDRYRGALLGLACGDAVGTAVEFKPRGSFPPLVDMHGGGPFDLLPGQWTDDTSMALCLADSLLECRGFDARDQMQRYLRWWRDGYRSSTGRCFDIGNTVRRALANFERTGEPYSGSTDPGSAGNGSLMRLAPVPLYFARDRRVAIEMAAQSSKTTHGAETAVDACRYSAGLIVDALEGRSKERILAPTHMTLTPFIAEVANGSFKRKRAEEIRGAGYVVASLEAALWAFHSTDDFRSGCLAAANLGDDADTTAAIYGQLAGAFYGEKGIPGEWRRQLAMSNEIRAIADRLLDERLTNPVLPGTA
jgi:ADP-ribosyl-[dinitrogen reductase] hydrolase